MIVALVVFGSLERQSGGYLYDRMLVSELERAGHSVVVVGQRDSPYLFQPIVSRLRRLLGVQRLPGGDSRPSVVVVDELNHAACRSVVAECRRAGIPVVGLVHHLRMDERRGFARAIAKRRERTFLGSCDAFLVNSPTTLRRTMATGANEGAAVHVASPGGDRLVPCDSPARERAGILFVGNVIPRKNVHVIIEAVSRLSAVRRERISPVVIAGSLESAPRYVGRLNRAVSRSQLTDTIHLVGRVDDDELGRRLCESIALVVPSAYEGFGIVYLEAMRAGAIPVAGSLGGAVDVIQNESDGFLVEPGNIDALVAVLERVADLSAEQRADWRNHLRKRAGEFPSWRASMEGARRFLEALA